MSLPKRIEKLERKASDVLRVRATPVPAPLDLNAPADVLALLAEQANAVRADASATAQERARTLGMLAALAIRAMEARDLDARLEAVERVLKLRAADERAKEKARRK